MDYLYVIISCLILCLIFIFWKDTVPKTEINIKQFTSTDPIITYYKSGGIAGYVIRLEIYNNHTYKLFDHDKLVKTENVDTKTGVAISEILKNYSVLEQIPKTNIDGTDYLYHIIKVDGQSFSLDVDSFDPNRNVYDKLVSQNKKLFDSIKQLELLTNK